MNIKGIIKRFPHGLKRFKWPIFIVTVVLLLVLIGYLTILFGGRFVVNEKDLILEEMTTVETDDGEVIEQIYTKNREVVSIDQVPEHVKGAFISIEDSRFYNHSGVDFKGIMRAVYKDIIAMKKVEGASTITQQLAKNMFLSNDKTWMRKTKEVMASLYLERNYTKDEILEMYLNRIYFGEGTYGIEAASKHYFQKSVSDLTIAQGALLAGLPKAPNTYSPFDHPEKAAERRNIVLSRMYDTGRIEADTLKQMQGTTLAVERSEEGKETWSNSYVDQVIHEAAEKYHISRDELKRGGYRIVVEMDPVIQRIAAEEMKNGEFVPGSSGPVEGAFTLMNHSTGGVVAIVGGRHFKHGDFNRIRAAEAPASTIKPFAVYGPAMMTGDYDPFSLLSDEKQTFGSNDYAPKNHDDRYDGEVSLYQALVESKNISAVWLLDQIGVSYAKGFLDKAGLPTKDKGLAIALGGLSDGYTPLQMVEAYGSLAQQGIRKESYTISKILDRNDKVIHEHPTKETEVFDKQTSWFLTEILQRTVNEGTASAGDYSKALAGKTGTHQNEHVWFAGYTPEYAGVLWMGYDQSGEINGSSVYPTRLMKKILEKVDQEKGLAAAFEKPDGVESLPEPVDLPVITDLRGSLDLTGLALLRGTIQWTIPDDERIVYRIFREEDGEDVKVGEVTGKNVYKVSAFGIFDQSTYYVIPVDPLTGKEGQPSNAVTLKWDL
ncbi:transglycosylase domain-containing protein [Halobacillus karajensis]|uniref:Penicillin-binding protein F n=1 Tax=Halobacillus karajensis TaxID=195088 RepID=A0A059NZL1_9BACI|nr:PBP1A family penicillin-binding protein [Halobacillus karajensis]CDQ21096.1 Penicillin-binding protein F [Halobacillus karajensis]CDQ24840.1 Penicillin-binding protein F [Halobacillus karajensis]CDQ28800.1 Penicillin-binding protein F [Halobacillus karajensis]